MLSRSAFGALSLYEKNEYLQELTHSYMTAKGQKPITLSKEALSRLRRFYSRRSFADLKLEGIKDPIVARSLYGLADAMHKGTFEQLIESETPPGANKALSRPPPLNDDQLMFFVPQLHDAPLKDDVNLMDVAPFSLSKTRRDDVLRYELKDCVITIAGGVENGLANAYDYDIFLNMVSYLAEEMRLYQKLKRKGRNTELPARVFRPTASQILKFCRRGNGGKQYAELEKALDRLQDTRIKITNFKKDARRATETFPLIDRYRVLSRTTSDKIDHVEIHIPEWVYNGVVNPSGTASILTLNPDYFLLTKPTARFIYRLARKAAGQGEAHYSVKDLHYRSGTTIPLSKFNRSIEALVRDAVSEPLPDYDLSLKPGRGSQVLFIKRREETENSEMDFQGLE
ncbi:replication initiator protein A [Pseudophaeobacter sp. 1A09344]|uniref:replication initiator protein A n=1 Tax=Pseudophaeobacter sp. 1A09344 TaxID=3098144 RepID=UPI0034D515BB